MGISILMYFNDHNPPHFHVKYNDFRAAISIANLAVLEGELPSRVLGLVIEWAELHRLELQADWDSLRTTGTFAKIEPLV